MENLIEPNIHPILVHFAYALSITALVSYLLAVFAPAGRWRETLRPAANWMLAFGALAIVATIAAGFQAYYSVNHDAPSHAAMTTHRNWAVPSGIAILLLALWRWRTREKPASTIFLVLLAAAALSLSATAWWGGKIVYGYGLGVKSMPAVTGEGHDHVRSPGQGHGEAGAEGVLTESHDDGHDHGGEAEGGHDDAADESHSHAANDSAAAEVDQATNAANAEGAYPDDPESVVDAYAAALRAGDEARVLELLAPDVIIAEGGGAERSAEQYAGHHMPADMAFTAAVDFSVKKRDLLASGDMAVVISESQIHGTYKDETVHSRMMETMVLRLADGRWRIAHIHWSSAPITGEHEH